MHDRVQSLDTPEQLEQRLEAIEAALARIEAAVTAPKED